MSGSRRSQATQVRPKVQACPRLELRSPGARVRRAPHGSQGSSTRYLKTACVSSSPPRRQFLPNRPELVALFVQRARPNLPGAPLRPVLDQIGLVAKENRP